MWRILKSIETITLLDEILYEEKEVGVIPQRGGGDNRKRRKALKHYPTSGFFILFSRNRQIPGLATGAAWLPRDLSLS